MLSERMTRQNMISKATARQTRLEMKILARRRRSAEETSVVAKIQVEGEPQCQRGQYARFEYDRPPP